MSDDVSTPIWFRQDADWKHGWGTLNKGQLTIWMHSVMIQPQDFDKSLLRRDIQSCLTREYKDPSPSSARGSSPQRHPRVIELRPTSGHSPDAQPTDAPATPILIEAVTATDFAKWSNAIDKYSAGAVPSVETDFADRASRKSRLSPDSEVIALLSCKCPGFLRSIAMARHSLELESNRRLSCNIAMAVTVLKSMHSNILDVDVNPTHVACSGSDLHGEGLFESGAVKQVTQWLQRMDVYLAGMVEQASVIAGSAISEHTARAASLLLQDVVYELEGVAKAADDADAAAAAAACDDSGDNAALGKVTPVMAASGRSAVGAAASNGHCRRATAPSITGSASVSSGSSGALNGRSANAISAMALTNSLAGPDPNVPESRSADRTYLNSLTYASSGVQPILPYSILPYETCWMHARGI